MTTRTSPCRCSIRSTDAAPKRSAHARRRRPVDAPHALARAGGEAGDVLDARVLPAAHRHHLDQVAVQDATEILVRDLMLAQLDDGAAGAVARDVERAPVVGAAPH